MKKSKIRPYVLPFAIVVGIFFHEYMHLLQFLIPYVIFTILLLNYAAVDFKHLKMTAMEWIFIAFQAVLSIGGYFVAKLCGATEIVAQGIMAGVLTPVAAAAVVVATMLGADRERMVTFTIACNLMVTLVAPVYFSFIGIQQTLPFFESFFIIIKKIFPVIALPLLVALALRKYAPKAGGFLSRHKGASFYLWAFAMTVTLGQTIDFMFLHGRENLDSILVIAAISVFMCVVQFGFGKWVGTRCGDRAAGGQMLGQKNSALGIWMANFYLVPLASVYPALYCIWQNLFNSWQLWREDHRKRNVPGVSGN